MKLFLLLYYLGSQVSNGFALVSANSLAEAKRILNALGKYEKDYLIIGIRELPVRLVSPLLTCRILSEGITSDGKDGYTPIKGTDYFTESEINAIKNEITSSLQSLLNEKLNIISDLDTIRSNSELATTALLSETDPIWIADKSSYYTKTQVEQLINSISFDAYIKKSSTTGLVKNDGTIDTSKYIAKGTTGTSLSYDNDSTRTVATVDTDGVTFNTTSYTDPITLKSTLILSTDNIKCTTPIFYYNNKEVATVDQVNAKLSISDYNIDTLKDAATTITVGTLSINNPTYGKTVREIIEEGEYVTATAINVVLSSIDAKLVLEDTDDTTDYDDLF